MTELPWLTVLRERLAGHTHELDFGRYPRAAVLIALTSEDEPWLILTQRASHLKSHPGDVALPGGKQDPEDPTLVATALREAHEEIGLAPERVRVVGELRPFLSMNLIAVTAVVGVIDRGLQFDANPHEISSVFAVPVSYFVEDLRESTDNLVREGEFYEMPVYRYDGYKIWGLTSRILLELVKVGFAPA